jgi:hypothetical protein
MSANKPIPFESAAKARAYCAEFPGKEVAFVVDDLVMLLFRMEFTELQICIRGSYEWQSIEEGKVLYNADDVTHGKLYRLDEWQRYQASQHKAQEAEGETFDANADAIVDLLVVITSHASGNELRKNFARKLIAALDARYERKANWGGQFGGEKVKP